MNLAVGEHFPRKTSLDFPGKAGHGAGRNHLKTLHSPLYIKQIMSN